MKKKNEYAVGYWYENYGMYQPEMMWTLCWLDDSRNCFLVNRGGDYAILIYLKIS